MPRGVPIFLDRENYEDQILLHGTYCNWKSAQACPCVDDESNASDPNCEICSGTGYTYYTQTEFKINRERLDIGGSNVGITKFGKIVSIDRVYDDDLTVADFHGNQVIFNERIPKSRRPAIDYTYSTVLDGHSVIGIYKGYGIIDIPNLTFQSTRGLEVPYEISNAINLVNLDVPSDTSLEVLDTYKNFVLVDKNFTIATVGDRIQMDIEYNAPHLMLVHGISEEMKLKDAYMLPEADASCSVPNHLTLSKGDLIILVVSKQTASLVREFTDRAVTLDHYDVLGIERVVDDKGVLYQNGTDYVQIGRDRIEALNDNLLIGKFSIKYFYRIMFMVMPNLPSLRYGENQPFPRHLMLKEYSRMKEETVKDV